MKKLFTLLTLLLCVASSAWAATVDDLVAISSDWTFIADDITSNGTTKLTANTLYCNGKIFAPTANSVAANKGNSTIGGVSHLNSLRLKNTQDQLCFKVSGACTVTFYTQSHSSRGIQAGTTAGGTELGTQEAGTSSLEINLTGATTVYLSSFGGDFYFAGFVVTFPGKSYAMQVGVDDESHGTATVSSTSVKEGASVTFRAFENVGWKFKNWTKTGSDPIEIVSTANPYVIEAVTGAISLTANFEEATTHTVTISAGETGALGNYYDNTVVTQNEGTTVTLPIKNSYFYKEGYTATGWTDGTNDYEFGEVITLNKDYAIYPKFELNGAALGDEVTTVTWDLSRSVADKLHIEGTTGYVVTTAQVGTATIDVPSYWDNSAGKLDNRFRADSYSQVNGGSTFKIPAIKGMTVTLTASYQISAKLDGEEMTATALSPYTATYTYEGDANEVEIIISGGSYFSTIVAEYPYTGIPGPADPTPVAGQNVTWDFSSATAQEAALNGATFKVSDTNTLYATDGKSKITYEAGSGDDMANSNGSVYYLKANGKTSSGNKRYFILQIAKSGKLSLTSVTNNGTYTITKAASVNGYGDSESVTTITTTTDGVAVEGNITYDAEKPYLFIGFPDAKIYTQKITWAENSEDIELTTTSTMQGWRAFYDASSGYTLDANTKAYVATKVEAQGESDVVVLNEIDAVPAETAVLLKTTNETQEGYSMTLTKASNVPTPDIINKLKRAGAATNTQVYRLGANDDGVGFFAYTKEAAKPDVVVLDVDSSSAGARSLTIAFADDEATAIQNVNDNVNLNKVVFDLQGRRVLEPGKGLYIVNGKKVVIK